MGAAAGRESDGWCIVLIVVDDDGSLVLVVEPTRVAVPCPDCGELSRRQHSWYTASARSAMARRSSAHARTQPALVLRRTRVLARFEGALARYARRTNDAPELLTTFALQAGGERGAGLARKASVPISPDTLLRVLHSVTDEGDERGPRVLGVDDRLRDKMQASRCWSKPKRSRG